MVGSPWQEAEAEDDQIFTPAITGQWEYFIALHEIGHAVLRHYSRRHRVAVLRQEEQAWRWALENSLVTPNAYTIKQIRKCMTRYWLLANTDKRVNEYVPEFRQLYYELRQIS